MFQSARIKLTIYYLIIIMTIGLLFSAVVYRGITFEIERSVRRQAVRFMPFHDVLVDEIHQQIIIEAKKRVLIELMFVNLGILILSGTAGYFLAGKTLKPIADILEEQKQFVADASHEIRTPLTSIKTEIEVAMRDKKLDLKSAKLVLKSNLEEIDNLKILSDYLLNANKYQNNGQGLSFEILNLDQLVNKAIKSMVGLANSKKIEIISELTAVRVRANTSSVLELATILLDNAIKYSKENGRVIVRVLKQHKNALLVVEDDGVGIKSSDLPHIFDRFFRASASRSKKQVQGFGLGLSIAKNIVEVNHGKIQVQSIFGKGTKFILRFPTI